MAIVPLSFLESTDDGGAGVLARVAAHRAEADQAAVAEMVAVLDYVASHRLEEGEFLEHGAIEPSLRGMFGAGPIHRLAPNGAEGELRLAGQGSFLVAEFAVAQIATVLAMSEGSARRYVGQLIELHDRLPDLYGQVVAGAVPVWKARQVAEQTIPLNPGAAAFVDRHLARFAHKLSLRRIERAVQAAILPSGCSRTRSTPSTSPPPRMPPRSVPRHPARHGDAPPAGRVGRGRCCTSTCTPPPPAPRSARWARSVRWPGSTATAPAASRRSRLGSRGWPRARRSP
ncbi:hypothetical protein [Nocardioides caldifontis]|uniref:hypothetical protein n=1 Tax=Nocardioides caldifontis TaxID=2588938 RepID=UPI0011DFFEE8|nr:hypothetical protein [Nocardioides caldifontis]